jgi:methylisocitrate lyase
MAGGILSSSILAPGSAAQSSRESSGSTSKGAQLRALLAKPDPIAVPVVTDILMVRLCELERFGAGMVGSSVAANWHGVPNLGLLSITEIVEFAVHIAGHTNLPLIADAEDGGGTPINIHRATREFERGGIAAVMYEDSAGTSHLKGSGVPLAAKDQMVDRIKAAVDARVDQNFIVIARTNALNQGHSMEQALERGVACAEAGADVIFFYGMRLEDHPKARGVVQRPLMALGTRTTTPDQAKAARVGLLFYHVDPIGHGALHEALKELKSTGKFENSSKMLLAPDVNARLTGSTDYSARARKYNMTK